MTLQPIYVVDTPVGRFWIAVSGDGRFHPVFDDESLGSYVSAAAAVDDLAGGHTYSVSGGHDTAALGIPADIGEWERASSQHT